MANYSRTTLAELDVRLLERAGGDGVFWTIGERQRAINEALDVWQLLTGDYNKSVTVTAVSTSDIITFASGDNVALPARVKPAAGGAALVDINFHNADAEDTGWRSASSATPDTWYPFGSEGFVISPKPTTDTDLSVFCIADDYHLSSGDTINIGDEEVVRILDYAQWYLSFKEGVTEFGENSSPLRELFMLAAVKRNKKLRKLALYRKFQGQQEAEISPDLEAEDQPGYR